MNIAVPVLLRLIEARSAREDDVGLVDQLLLELEQLCRRELELAELVHRIENDKVSVQVPRERQHHRRVIPGDQSTADRRNMGVKQTGQRRLTCVLGHVLREMRNDDPDARRVISLADLQVRGVLRSNLDRLFPENYV